MKILHINTFEKGGAAHAALQLHMSLLHQDVDSHFLFLTQQQHHIPKAHSYLKKERKGFLNRLAERFLSRYSQHHQYQRQITSFPPSTGYVSLPVSPYDVAAHEQIRVADIIHLHWTANFLDWPSFFSKIRQPIVWTLHDANPFLGIFHVQEDLKKVSSHNVLALEKKFLDLKIKSISQVEKLHIVTPSHQHKQYSVQSKTFNDYPHTVIPNSVDQSVFKPLSQTYSRNLFNLAVNKKVVLFVAYHTEVYHKGFDLLLKAIELMPDREDVVFVAAGNTSATTLPEKVIRIGQISDPRLMSALYNAADLFVIPSREDNFPNTVLESLACGTPVVGFAIGGIPEMINDQENGLLVKAEDVEDLADKINWMLEHDEERMDMGQKGILTISSKFSEIQQVSAYMKLYSDILNG